MCDCFYDASAKLAHAFMAIVRTPVVRAEAAKLWRINSAVSLCHALRLDATSVDNTGSTHDWSHLQELLRRAGKGDSEALLELSHAPRGLTLSFEEAQAVLIRVYADLELVQLEDDPDLWIKTYEMANCKQTDSSSPVKSCTMSFTTTACSSASSVASSAYSAIDADELPDDKFGFYLNKALQADDKSTGDIDNQVPDFKLGTRMKDNDTSNNESSTSESSSSSSTSSDDSSLDNSDFERLVSECRATNSDSDSDEREIPRPIRSRSLTIAAAFPIRAIPEDAFPESDLSARIRCFSLCTV